MKQYDCYLFDFDGTIMDTEKSIKSCVMYALNFYGIEENDPKNLDGFIGPPLLYSFKHFYGATDELAERLIKKYREKYSENGCLDCSLYDGVVEVFEKLKEQGKKIAIASSKPTIFVEKISKHFDIYKYFDAVSAEDLDKSNSGKKALIENALKLLSCTDKSKALMIGDRYLDIEGAKAAGVDSAGAVYGFGSEDELKKAGADYLLYDVRKLLC
ncbi:MAG TPA: HAD-IA family hydrolase [Oscillospiraceae bacterium]|nr:HAD-IA family hydrolase [Oscillospiraceae bacterium]